MSYKVHRTWDLYNSNCCKDDFERAERKKWVGTKIRIVDLKII